MTSRVLPHSTDRSRRRFLQRVLAASLATHAAGPVANEEAAARTRAVERAADASISESQFWARVRAEFMMADDIAT